MSVCLAEPSERDVQRVILDYLRLSGIPAWPTHNARYPPASPGVSDVLGILPGGKFLAVEVKGREGRLSKEQADFLDRVRRHGGVAVVARSVEDVITGLRGVC